jgi:hypothetical protein
MSGLTPKAHTQAVLKRMNLAGSVPGNLDRNNDAGGDNYGITSARSSDASSFGMSGAPKSPHMGRPGRQSGGRISGDLVRTRRTPEETAKDIASGDKAANALAKDREGRKKGGRIGRWKGGADRDMLGQKDALASDAPDWMPMGPSMPGEREYYNFIRGGLGTSKIGAPRGKGGIGSDATAEPTNQAKGGRIRRQSGGSIGEQRRATAHLAAEDYRTGPDYRAGSASDEMPKFSNRYDARNALDDRAKGGRVRRAGGGVIAEQNARFQKQIEDDDAAADRDIKGKRYSSDDPERAKGGRVNRAHGGRTKGKTTVNVIIGGQKAMTPPPGPPPMPPPMAAPGPVGPPKPPMPPPGMGPPGGAPPGMGGPPPGPPMLRARGGRIGKQFGGGAPMGASQPQQGGMGSQPPQMSSQQQQGGMNPNNPNYDWKAPIQQQFDAERAASSTPGVGITDPARLEAARQAKMQSVNAYKDAQHPQGFQGDPNSLVPRGTTSGGVNQYYNPATGGMFVGNPFRNSGGQQPQPIGGTAGGPDTGYVPQPAQSWAQRPAVMATGGVARAKGGRVEIGTPGVHNYGKAGVKHGKVEEEYGAGSGLGRQERARRQK